MSNFVSVPLREDQYRPALELLKRSQSYGKQILWLSTLGAAGTTCLILWVIAGEKVPFGFRDKFSIGLLGLGIASFAIAACAALAYFYLSTNVFSYYLKWLRFLNCEPPETLAADRLEFAMKRAAETSNLWQAVSSFAFVVAVAFVLVGFGKMLCGWIF